MSRAAATLPQAGVQAGAPVAAVPAHSILVLDIDGTLTDSVPMHQAAFLAAMLALSLPGLDTNWGNYPHHTDTGILAHALDTGGRAPLPPAALRAFEDDIDRHFALALTQHGLREIAGARAFVREAAAAGWGVVFATGGVRRVSQRKLQAVDIPYEEAMLVTASEHASRTDLVAQAVARARQRYDLAAPRRILSVGDGRWDLEVAQHLGLEFIGVGKPPQADVLVARGATVFADLREALAVLRDQAGDQRRAAPTAPTLTA